MEASRTANDASAGVDTAGRAAVSFLFLQTHIMKILIIGGGGREHAIAWKLRQSASVEKIWCAPGNGGISRDAECVPLNVGDVKAAADLATKLGADLTIVGPELPLVQGIADEFKQRGLAILGPPKMRGATGRQQDFCERVHDAQRNSDRRRVWRVRIGA